MAGVKFHLKSDLQGIENLVLIPIYIYMILSKIGGTKGRWCLIRLYLSCKPHHTVTKQIKAELALCEALVGGI